MSVTAQLRLRQARAKAPVQISTAPLNRKSSLPVPRHATSTSSSQLLTFAQLSDARSFHHLHHHRSLLTRRSLYNHHAHRARGTHETPDARVKQRGTPPLFPGIFVLIPQDLQPITRSLFPQRHRSPAPTTPTMWSSLPLLTLLATHALAQSSGILQFGPGQLPACAQACSQLQNAQTACISVPSTEHSCFCQSAYLTQQTNLFQTPDGTCVDTCTAPADRQQIQTWFKGYCANPQQNAPAPAPAPAGGAQTSTAPAPAASTSSFAGTPVDESPPSW